MDILTRVQTLVELRKSEQFSPDFIRRNVEILLKREGITDATTLKLINAAVDHYLAGYIPNPTE